MSFKFYFLSRFQKKNKSKKKKERDMMLIDFAGITLKQAIHKLTSLYFLLIFFHILVF